jgi:chromosome segregation ATPase
MIFRLMAEQKDEDDHKNWCDLEVSKTNTSINTKKDKSESLKLEIEDDEATVEVLENDARDATEKSTTIQEHMDEITNVRNEGHKENKAALKDAEDAQKALANAIAVLEAYYKDSGAIEKQAWEFAQTGEGPVELPEEPSTWDASYTGVADPSKQPGGIVAVLKQVASDFSTMEADTRASEESDQMEFNEEMKKCKIEKARSDTNAEMKTAEAGRLGDKISAAQKRLKGLKNELGAWEQYMKDLEPACLKGDSTYEDRKKARADEIAALKEAQVILADAFKKDDDAPPALFQASTRKHSNLA